MNRFSRFSTEWKEAVFGKEQLPVRVLVVADGGVNFIAADFGLTRFVTALQKSAAPGEIVEVTTAHRSGDEINGAQLKEFKFDKVENGVPILHITRFEQVWLFGHLGECPKDAITPSELQVITDFMNNGGGVFATGDHADLGAAMCGNVPRVRKMRRWHVKNLSPDERPAPSRNDSTRLDTLREGIDPGFKPDDQRDDVPQEIRPKFFFNETKGTVQPHDLLATETFAISILPDHMHEGECVSADELQKRMDKDEEIKKDFPERLGTTEPVWPDVVAIATSAAGTFEPRDKMFPVDPRSFIIISAYDGHEVEVRDKSGTHKLGRVVVDASFHHFVNVNLKGFFDDCDVPKKEFELFARYYRNILHYLLPPDKQRAYFLQLLRALRFSAPLLEDIQNLSADNWQDVIYAGTIANRVISDNFSPAHARRCALVMISDLKPDVRAHLEEVIDLWQPRNEVDDSLFFLNSESVVIAVLGRAILGVDSSRRENHDEVSHAPIKLEAEGERLESIVAKNLHQGVTQLQQRLGRLAQHLERFSKISATKEDVMGKCHTETGKSWESKIDDEVEGNFEITEDDNGGITGKLVGTAVKISGKCRQKAGKPHKIRFRRHDTGHLYVGVFVEGTDEKIQGLKIDLDSLRNFEEAPLADGDEDWVAVKVGTL